MLCLCLCMMSSCMCSVTKGWAGLCCAVLCCAVLTLYLRHACSATVHILSAAGAVPQDAQCRGALTQHRPCHDKSGHRVCLILISAPMPSVSGHDACTLFFFFYSFLFYFVKKRKILALSACYGRCILTQKKKKKKSLHVSARQQRRS